MTEFPRCPACDTGTLVPLSDYGQEAASVVFNAWACINPDCGFSLRVDVRDTPGHRRHSPTVEQLLAFFDTGV